MTHDDVKAVKDTRFRPAGAGLAITHLCDFCRLPKGPLGSKRVGPFKRFKCAQCVQKAAA